MNSTVASLLGAFVCCIMPILSFAAGWYVSRHGSPLIIRWRGLRDHDDEIDN
jgi:hypothetical protein